MAVVGIDLGTTNSVVATLRSGRVEVLADEQGRRLLPSVVSFPPGGDVLVGYPAKERRLLDAKNTIASVKRLLGRALSSEEIQRARQRFSFELSEGLGQGPLVIIRGQPYSLPEISAFILQRTKQIAEAALGEAIARAVITVPANFNELQRAATKVAGRIADFDVMRIINEPTAAALAYGYGRSSHERIAVYDFGGGTFDFTLLELSGNVFEVLATAGESFLGGDDIDMAIAERMADAFMQTYRRDLRAQTHAFDRLRVAAENLKVDLTARPRAAVRLTDLAFGSGGAPMPFDFTLTREELDRIADPLVDRTLEVCREALAMARLPATAFDRVILVGGSTRIGLVRRRVEMFFGCPPLDRLNPEEVVAIGAAIQAAALSEVEARRSIPAPPVPSRRNSKPLPDEELTHSVEQASRLARSTAPPALPAPSQPPSSPLDAQGPQPPAQSAKRSSPPVLVDVTPLALVVETVGGFCDVVVPRNAKIPCERTRAFTTSSDMQAAVRVRVGQGDAPLFPANTYLGEVELSGLRPGPRGAIVIRVRFEIDESGTLKVSATDAATGRQAQAVLQLVGIAGAQSVAAMRARHVSVQVR